MPLNLMSDNSKHVPCGAEYDYGSNVNVISEWAQAKGWLGGVVVSVLDS